MLTNIRGGKIKRKAGLNKSKLGVGNASDLFKLALHAGDPGFDSAQHKTWRSWNIIVILVPRREGSVVQGYL